MAVTDDLPLALGRNLLSFTYESDLTARASRIAPTSQALGGVPTVLGFARWRIAAPDSGAKTFVNEDPAGGLGAIGFDDQFVGWYVLLERTGESFRITDTDATTQTFTLATWSASLVAGAVMQLRRTAPGTIHSAFSYRSSAAPQSVPIMDAEVSALVGSVITVRDGWLSGSTPPVASDGQHVGRSVRLSEFLATDEITDFVIDFTSGIAAYTYTFADVSAYQVGDWLRRTADVFPGFAYGDINTLISNAFAAAMTIVAVDTGANTVTVVSRDGGTSLNRVIYDTAQFGAGYNDVRVYRPVATLRTVTASSGSAHTLTLDSVAGFSIGAGPGAVEILIETTSTSGKVPWYLEHPLYVQPPPVGIGVQVRTIDRSTLIGVATLNGNAVMRTWTTPTAMPDGWLGGAGLNAVSGTPTAFNIAQNTNPLFTRVGGKSLFFSGFSGVITTAPIPWTPAYDGQALSLRLSLLLTQWVPNANIFVQFGILGADGVILPWWSQPRSVLLKPPASTLATPPFKEFPSNIWDDVVLNDFDITEPSDHPVNLRPNASDIADMAAAQGIVAVIQFNGGGTKLEGYLDGAMITVSHEAPADVREFCDANRLHQDTNAALAELGPPQATIAVDFFDAKRMNPTLDEPDAAKGVVADVDVPSLGIDHVRRRITDVVRNMNVEGETRITIGKKARRLSDAVAKAPATKPPPATGGTTPSGGTSGPTVALTVALDPSNVPTATAVADASVTRVKFAWSVTGVPSDADVRAATSKTVAPFTDTMAALASGATIYVAAYAYDIANTESPKAYTSITATDGVTPPMTNLVRWYKADAGITKDGSNRVSAWADQSSAGLNLSQPTSGNQPIWVASGLDGKPYVSFDESRQDRFPLDLSFMPSADWTIYVVALRAGGAQSFVFGAATGGVANQSLYCGYNKDGFDNVVLGFWGDDVSASTPHGDALTHVLMFRRESTVGRKVAQDATSNTGTAGTLSGIAGGGVLGAGGGAYDGSTIYEFLAYSAAQSTIDEAAVRSYLAGRYPSLASGGVSGVSLTYEVSGGDVIVAATAPSADSVKIAASLSGTPSDATVRAATAVTTRPFTAVFAKPAPGDTLSVGSFAYLSSSESPKATLAIVGDDVVDTSGGAPTDAGYVLAASDAGIPNGRVLTDTASIEFDVSVAGQASANVAAVAETLITTSDVTTNDATTAKHGFLKKLSNDATEYMDGTGNWSVPSGGGGGGSARTDFGSHAYWRVLSTQQAYCALAALLFKDETGASIATTGGTALESSHFSSFPASNVFDGNDTTFWESNNSTAARGGQWVGYHFASAVKVMQVALQSASAMDGSYPPDPFEIQYSDDGIQWVTVIGGSVTSSYVANTPYWFNFADVL